VDERKLVSVGSLKKGDTVIIDNAPCKIQQHQDQENTVMQK